MSVVNCETGPLKLETELVLKKSPHFYNKMYSFYCSLGWILKNNVLKIFQSRGCDGPKCQFRKQQTKKKQKKTEREPKKCRHTKNISKPLLWNFAKCLVNSGMVNLCFLHKLKYVVLKGNLDFLNILTHPIASGTCSRQAVWVKKTCMMSFGQKNGTKIYVLPLLSNLNFLMYSPLLL